MKTVGITKELREKLRNFEDDGESTDEAINRLLDIVEPYMSEDVTFDRGTTNINLSSETMMRIKSFQIREKESYGRILKRALYLYGKHS